MKRSQKSKMLSFLQEYGWITNRVSMVNLNINNPFQRMKELRQTVDIEDMFVKNQAGVRFKVFYIDKYKLGGFLRRNNLIEV